MEDSDTPKPNLKPLAFLLFNQEFLIYRQKCYFVARFLQTGKFKNGATRYAGKAEISQISASMEYTNFAILAPSYASEPSNGRAQLSHYKYPKPFTLFCNGTDEEYFAVSYFIELGKNLQVN